MPAAQARPLALATDCSGMETPVMALQNLGIVLDHVFSCDVNKNAKKTILENFPPKIFYDDLTVRDNTKAPKADLYVAGFPCQPFSIAGKHQGFADARGRGEIFWHVRDYIEQRKPKVFVLENVAGLARINKGEYFAAIIEALEALGAYNIYHRVLNTKQHGVPQNRPRIYIVGIKRSCDDGTFDFPQPVETPSINVFLDPKPRKPPSTALPPKSQSTALRNVKLVLKELTANGSNPLKNPYIVDHDSSTYRFKYHKDVSPCLTRSRAGGHWVTNRMRRMTKAEMMRLQGMNPEKFKQVVSDNQLGHQIGNAMSVNVLERLFVRLLPAAGLVRKRALVDRWGSGKTPAEFIGAGAKRRAAAGAGAAAKRARA